MSVRWGHLPHHMNKHDIYASIFWTSVNFGGAVAPKIPQPFSIRFYFMGHLKNMYTTIILIA
jgi:hypothetical protein